MFNLHMKVHENEEYKMASKERSTISWIKGKK